MHAIIVPSLWNQLLPSTQSTLLTGEPIAPFRSLNTTLSLSLWVSRTGSTSDWCALQEALYNRIDTIQYNRPMLSITDLGRNRAHSAAQHKLIFTFASVASPAN